MFLQEVNAVHQYLAPFGYEFVVIDGGWSIDNNGTQHIDEYGRPQPAPDKFPHGFQFLSEKVHALGLKFGVWVGRGITQTAIDADTPIYGADSNVTAKDIFMPSQPCPWDARLFSVDPSHEGSQQFIDSLYAQFAEWGVDFIKNDCVFGEDYVPAQIEMVSNAMDSVSNANADFTYSLSPGDNTAPTEFNGSVFDTTSLVDLYRITRDTWDEWESDILTHFNVTAEWAQAQFIGGKGRNGASFPDLDLLPLGFINSPQTNDSRCGPFRMTSLTQSQQRVVVTLWGMARSPFMFGGSAMALANDSYTVAMLSNEYVLGVNANSSRNRQVFAEYDEKDRPMSVAWAAEGPKDDFYVALFNVDVSSDAAVEMEVSFASIGGDLAKYDACRYQEAGGFDQGVMSGGMVKGLVPSNDTLLFYLYACTQ